MNAVYVFKRFERFWHWAQALLVFFLLATGFEVHGTFRLLGWERAANLHRIGAWTLIGLWLFAIFWHFTTDEWRQYVPTTQKLKDVMDHYSSGIFRGEPHPWQVTPLAKHNPLQRVAYLGVKLLINPVIWLSGLAYLYWDVVRTFGWDLRTVALVHTAAAFAMLVFAMAHLYLATTGPTPLTYIKAMITGWHREEAGH